MKFTKKQQLFIDKIFYLILNNNFYIQYQQTFKKKMMIFELDNKNFSTNRNKIKLSKQNLQLELSCCKINDGYMSENIMFCEELISDEIVVEIKTLFKVGNLDDNCKNISYMLCILKKMKKDFQFIGIMNKQFNRIEPKFCIRNDVEKSTDNYSIWGLYK